MSQRFRETFGSARQAIARTPAFLTEQLSWSASNYLLVLLAAFRLDPIDAAFVASAFGVVSIETGVARSFCFDNASQLRRETDGVNALKLPTRELASIAMGGAVGVACMATFVRPSSIWTFLAICASTVAIPLYESLRARALLDGRVGLPTASALVWLIALLVIVLVLDGNPAVAWLAGACIALLVMMYSLRNQATEVMSRSGRRGNLFELLSWSIPEQLAVPVAVLLAGSNTGVDLRLLMGIFGPLNMIFGALRSATLSGRAEERFSNKAVVALATLAPLIFSPIALVIGAIAPGAVSRVSDAALLLIISFALFRVPALAALLVSVNLRQAGKQPRAVVVRATVSIAMLTGLGLGLTMSLSSGLLLGAAIGTAAAIGLNHLETNATPITTGQVTR